MLRFAIAIAVTFVALMLTPAPSAAQNLRACTNPQYGQSPTKESLGALNDGAIAACTRFLNSGRLSTKQRYEVLIKRASYYTHKDYSQHLADLAEAIRIRPDAAEAYYWRGVNHHHKKAHREAIADLTLAIRHEGQLGDVDRTNAYWMRAYSYEALDDTDGAIAAWTAKLQARGTKMLDTVASKRRGLLYMKKQEFAKAASDFTTAIERAGAQARSSAHGNLLDERPFLYVERAKSYFGMGRYPAAIADFDEAFRMNASGVSGALFFSERAKALEADRQTQRALADYRRADKEFPNNPETLGAIARLEGGQRQQPHTVVAQAQPPRAALGPLRKTDRRDCLESYGGGDHETAIPACTRLLASPAVKSDERVRVLVMRGIWYQASEQYDLAISDLSEAVRLNATKDGLIALAQAYEAKGDLDKAVATISDYISGYRDDVDGYHVRANLHAKRHDFDKAIADMTAKIRLGGRDHGDYILRAEYWHQKGDVDRAIADYTDAIRVSPRDQTSFERRARLYDEKGDMQRALEDFRKALSIDPGVGKSMGIDKQIARLERDIASGFTPETKVAKASPAVPSGVKPLALLPVTENRIALVIGNSAYRHNVALTNPRADAEALAATLKRIGFKSVELKFDLSREQLVDALRRFAGEAARADWAVIYFAGHGLQVGGINYLIPVDAKLASDRDVSFEAVAMEHVLNAVEGARKLRLAIMDACRDNPFVKTMTRSLATRSLGRGLAALDPQRSTLVAFAARDGQVALDGAGANSPYIVALVRHLETPGLEINLLFRKVRDEVLAQTGNDQEPFTYGSLSSEALYFRPVAAAQ